MLVDVIAELNSAVTRHPAGQVDPRNRYFSRQTNVDALARGNSSVDPGSIPAWRILKNPGCEIPYVVDSRASVGEEAVVGGEQVPDIGVVHVDGVWVRHIDFNRTATDQGSVGNFPMSLRDQNANERPANTLTGTAGDDVITIVGGLFAQRLPVTPNCIPRDNVIIGGVGNDTLSGNAGKDTLDGGAGNDTYVIDNAGEVVVETASTPAKSLPTKDKTGRNNLCPCGSGKKYKKCCHCKREADQRRSSPLKHFR